jgi:hypothetical protein
MWRVRRQGVAREPQERDTMADEAFMGAAAEGIGGFEILDETVERVKTRFQQFLVEQLGVPTTSGGLLNRRPVFNCRGKHYLMMDCDGLEQQDGSKLSSTPNARCTFRVGIPLSPLLETR